MQSAGNSAGRVPGDRTRLHPPAVMPATAAGFSTAGIPTGRDVSGIVPGEVNYVSDWKEGLFLLVFLAIVLTPIILSGLKRKKK